MFDSIKHVYDWLVMIQLYPLVTLAVLAVYFLLRQRYNQMQVALWVPIAASVIGQFAFHWPASGDGTGLAQDAFINVTMGMVQSGVAIGIYSFLDKYGLMDRLGKVVQKKIDEKGGNDAAPPSV